MQFDYRARWQRLTLEFASQDVVISVRVVVNGQVRITQCRNTAVLSTELDVSRDNTITIENLTPNAMLWIQNIKLGHLPITNVMHEFATTQLRDTGEQFTCFIKDLQSRRHDHTF